MWAALCHLQLPGLWKHTVMPVLLHSSIGLKGRNERSDCSVTSSTAVTLRKAPAAAFTTGQGSCCSLLALGLPLCRAPGPMAALGRGQIWWGAEESTAPSRAFSSEAWDSSGATWPQGSLASHGVPLPHVECDTGGNWSQATSLCQNPLASASDQFHVTCSLQIPYSPDIPWEQTWKQPACMCPSIALITPCHHRGGCWKR